MFLLLSSNNHTFHPVTGEEKQIGDKAHAFKCQFFPDYLKMIIGNFYRGSG